MSRLTVAAWLIGLICPIFAKIYEIGQHNTDF